MNDNKAWDLSPPNDNQTLADLIAEGVRRAMAEHFGVQREAIDSLTTDLASLTNRVNELEARNLDANDAVRQSASSFTTPEQLIAYVLQQQERQHGQL